MNESSTVVVDINEKVARLTLNRPDALNAFNRQQRRQLLNAVNRINDYPDVRVVILAGNGRGFCAGADLSETHPSGQTVEQRINEEYKPVLLGIAESTKTWIACVHGAAAGIGSSLALCCDLLVMDEKAFLFQAFSAVGLIPDGGLSLQLQRQLGKKRAFEIIALGQKLTAEECHRCGIANRVAVNGEALEQAEALAAELLKRAPLSLQYTKEVLRLVEQQSLSQAISTEAKLQKLANQSEDHREGKRAFLEKRPPQWKGR